MSIHWSILRTCLRRPLRTAIVDDRRAYRAIDLLVAALHLASHLQQAASRSRSDIRHATSHIPAPLGVLLPTSGAFPIAALAGWFLGRTIVPLNYLLKPEELQYVIDDCGTDTIVTVQPMLDFLGAAPRVPSLVRLEDVSFKGVPDPLWPARASDDDLALLLYTSGTSGKPKGVMLTHGNITTNISQIVRWVDFGPSDTLLGVLPQFHSFGLTVLTLLPLMIGCKVVYTARFVPAKLIRLLREHRPTVFIAIPSMYNALLHAKDAAPPDFASLRFTVSGGEPLPGAVLRGFQDRFKVTINEGYGLTETSPVTNWCRPFEFRPRSVGRPLPDIVQHIINPDTGERLPPDRDGEVRMKGPNIMRGYFNLPEETGAAFDQGGFFRTGDIGRHDRDGHLYITGRLKEMLIIGGENVFPREIEEVLNRHPSIKDSGVIGITDPIRGELPLAFVEVKEDPGSDGTARPLPFDQRALLGWCRQHLAGYKVPTEIRRIDSLPRSPTGKVLRRELKKLAASNAPQPESPSAT